MFFFIFNRYLVNVALSFALGFPCIMGSRLLLNLREIARKEELGSLFPSHVVSSIRFMDGGASVRSVAELRSSGRD